MPRTNPAFKIGTNGIYISRMTEHDLLEVVEIEQTCGLSRWGWDAYQAELARENETLMRVARSRLTPYTVTSRGIVGFIAARMTINELHINNVAVLEDYRRCGIGGALLGAVLEEGAGMDARSAILEVRASNLAAQALYERYGFRITGRRRNYYKEPTEDALLMSVVIGDQA